MFYDIIGFYCVVLRAKPLFDKIRYYDIVFSCFLFFETLCQTFSLFAKVIIFLDNFFIDFQKIGYNEKPAVVLYLCILP